MEALKIADSYASAIFSLAEEKNLINEIESDILALSEIFSGESRLQEFLDSPRISQEEKLTLMLKSLESKVHKETMNFIQVVIVNRRQNFFELIFTRFTELLDAKKQKAKVEVITATKLPNEDIQKIAAILKNRINKELYVESSIDKSLLGGFIVKCGDLRIDSSVKSQLLNMKNSLIGQKTVLDNII